MNHSIRIGLAMAVTAALGFADNGDKAKDNGPKNGPNNDGTEKSRTESNELRSSLWRDDVVISYTPGAGVTFTSGGDSEDSSSLNISGRLHAKFYYYNQDNGADTATFRARRIRTNFEGHVFNKDITYRVQLDHTGPSQVIDTFAGWRFYKDDDGYINLRLGLQKFGGALQFDTDTLHMEFAERAIATRLFSEARGLGGRLMGALMANENGKRSLFWHAGVMNNDISGGAAPNQLGLPGVTNRYLENELGNNKLNFNFGIDFSPQGMEGDTESWSEGDLEHSGNMESVFGAQYFIGQDRIGGVDNDVNMLNIHGAVKLGSGFAAQGEYFMRNDDPAGPGDADSNGWYAQASYTTAPGNGTQWAFGGRVSMVDLDDANPVMGGIPVESDAAWAASMTRMDQQGNTFFFNHGTITELSGVVSAYYFKHALKTQIQYSYFDIDSSNNNVGDQKNHEVSLLFTLAF